MSSPSTAAAWRSAKSRIGSRARKISLPAEQFRLEFLDGTVVSSLECTAKPAGGVGDGDLLFSSDKGIAIRVRLALAPGKAYLRKQISVRRTGGPQRRLIVAELENWRGVKAAWTSMRADRYPFGSHPIYCEDLWAGVEFVAAFNEYGPDGFVLRSRPGGTRLGAEWLDLHSTVIGVAEPGRVRQAFLRDIDDIRAAPARMTCCYNSWWTLPKRFTEHDLLDLAAELKRRLYDPHKVFFDVVAIDAGWSDPQSIWQVNRQFLPQGFGPLRRTSSRPRGGWACGSRPAPFTSWPPIAIGPAQRFHGGEARLRPLAGDRPVAGRSRVSVADQGPVAAAGARNGFAHVKFDGLIPLEDVIFHDDGRNRCLPLIRRTG